MRKQYTRIPYMYADASNYKAGATVFVTGAFTRGQLATISKKLDGGEFFIPTQVGITALQPTLASFPSEDDHVWHRLVVADFTAVDTVPEGETVFGSATELATRFLEVEWDIRKELERLGLDA